MRGNAGFVILLLQYQKPQKKQLGCQGMDGQTANKSNPMQIQRGQQIVNRVVHRWAK